MGALLNGTEQDRRKSIESKPFGSMFRFRGEIPGSMTGFFPTDRPAVVFISMIDLNYSGDS